MAGRDPVGEEVVEFAEDVVDFHGGLELLDGADEGFGVRDETYSGTVSLPVITDGRVPAAIH